MAYRITPKRHEVVNLGTTTTDKTIELMQLIIWENYGSPGTITCVNFVDALIRDGLPLNIALAFMAYKLAYYEPDIDVQTIRTPDRTLDDSAANCVDYTVLICCTALHFTQDVYFELAAYAPGRFEHVYPVVDGNIIDVVPGQNQKGEERILRRMNFFPSFDQIAGRSKTPVEVRPIKLWTLKY
jgi:hypothetical protein